MVGIFGIVRDPSSLNMPTHIKKVIAFSSLLARKAILFKWKDVTPPSHNQWLRDVMYNLKLEKIRCTLNGSCKNFYKAWDPFMQYVKSLPGLEL